jgi:hypothetical protein
MAFLFANLVFFLPAVAGAFYLVHRNWPDARALVGAGSALTSFLIFEFCLLGFSFKAVLMNLVCVIVACSAYSFLAITCLAIPIKPLRVSMLVIPIRPFRIIYILGDICLLCLGLIVIGDGRPEHTEQMKPDLVCTITEWGMAGASSGYTVHLYKSLGGLPLLERSIASIPVTQAGYSGTQPEDVSCADAMAKYAP